MRLQEVPKFYFTNSASIDTIAKKKGQVILSKDEQVLFIDVNASTRLRLDCVVHIESSDLLPLAPLDKIYVDDSTKDLYIYINDDWVKIPSQGHAEITVVKDNEEYDTHVVEAGNGLDVEEDEETGNIVLSVALTDYYLEFTSSDIDSGGILTINDARVGSFVILDNTGKLVIPAMTQVGTSVQINLNSWVVTGTWKVFFPLGAAASSDSINDIVETILSSNYVTSSASAPSLDIECGKVYQFTNALSSLTLTSVEHGHRPTELRFTAGNDFVFTYETGSTGIVGLRGSEPTYTTGSTYHVNIVDGFMEVKPVTMFTDSSPDDTNADDEYQDCPACNEHTYINGHCENCGYVEGDDLVEDCPNCGERTYIHGYCDNCGYSGNEDNNDEGFQCPSCGDEGRLEDIGDGKYICSTCGNLWDSTQSCPECHGHNISIPGEGEYQCHDCSNSWSSNG